MRYLFLAVCFLGILGCKYKEPDNNIPVPLPDYHLTIQFFSDKWVGNGLEYATILGTHTNMAQFFFRNIAVPHLNLAAVKRWDISFTADDPGIIGTWELSGHTNTIDTYDLSIRISDSIQLGQHAFTLSGISYGEDGKEVNRESQTISIDVKTAL